MGKVFDINGKRIREDRDDRGFSRPAFLARIEELCGKSISDSTLRRAEEAGKASEQTLRKIARAFGFPPARYTIDPSQNTSWRTHYDLNGEWETYYIEDDVNTEPYAVMYRLFIKQTGTELSGVYELIKNDHPEGYTSDRAFVLKGHVADDMAMGIYYIDGDPHPMGAGVFQMKLMKGADWAEGICTFYADTTEIATSIHLWLRKNSRHLRLYQKQARNLFEQNKIFLKAPWSTQ